MKDGMPENDDLSGAVEALFTSAEWEQRLAEARESRRKILAAKARPDPEPVVPEPVFAEQEPEPETAEPLAPKPVRIPYAALAFGLVAAGVAAVAMMWPQTEPLVPVDLRHRIAATDGAIPLSYAIAETPLLPMRYILPLASTPQTEMLDFGLEGSPADVFATATTRQDPNRLVATPGDLPLITAPPVTVTEVYADLLIRLRLAARNATIRVHLPPEVEARRDDLETVSSAFAAPSDVVRYYHRSDAQAARDAARAIEAEAQDFTRYSPSPPEGTLEVWLSAR